MSRTPRTPRSRTLLAAVAVSAVALAGCSSSDDASDASDTTAASSGDTSATSASGGAVETIPTAQCVATGELSGAQTATFDEEPTTLTTYEDATDFPPAVYQFGTDVKVTLNARSDGPGDILVYVNGSNYSSEDGTGIDIAADGSGATVDAEIPDMLGADPVTLTVDVTC